jgi:hypothetical protein
MAQSEPPSTASSSPSRFFRVGKDSRGHWVAQDQYGLCGGLFTSRADALKFAMFENGRRPQAVIMVPGVLELDMSVRPQQQFRTAATNATVRRAA